MAYYYRNGQSERNYLVCLEVRKLPFDLNYYTSMSTSNSYQGRPIFFFIFLKGSISVSHKKKNAFAFQSGFVSFTDDQDKHDVILSKGALSKQKTQDTIGCALLQWNDNQPSVPPDSYDPPMLLCNLLNYNYF